MNSDRTSKETRSLRNDELDVVNGGIMIIGGKTLGGPDTAPLSYFSRYIGNPEESTS